MDEQKVVVIESGAARDEFERVVQLSPIQTMTPAGPVQAIQTTVVRAGWTHYN